MPQNMNTFQIRVAKYRNKIPDDVKLSADVDKFFKNYKKERFEVKGNYWELSTLTLHPPSSLQTCLHRTRHYPLAG